MAELLGDIIAVVGSFAAVGGYIQGSVAAVTWFRHRER